MRLNYTTDPNVLKDGESRPSSYILYCFMKSKLLNSFNEFSRLMLLFYLLLISSLEFEGKENFSSKN